MASSTHWRLYMTQRVMDYTSSIKLVTAHPRALDGSELAGLTDVTMTPNYDDVTYPESNLMDGDNGTYVMAIWDNGGTNELKVEYTFSSAVEVGQIELRCNADDHPTVQDHTLLTFANFFVAVEASTDGGTTWVPELIIGDYPFYADTTYNIALSREASVSEFPNTRSMGGSGGIFGIVTEDSVVAPGYPVALIDTYSMNRIGYTLSESDGGYAFVGINPNKEYVVLSRDPTDASKKRAIVWDRIQPINARATYTEGSAFTARRFRDSRCGPICTLDDVIASTVNHIKGTVFGGMRYELHTDAVQWGEWVIAVGSTPDEQFRYVERNAVPTLLGGGLAFAHHHIRWPQNSVNENAKQLTFEYIFIPPNPGDTEDLIISWGGVSTTGKTSINHLSSSYTPTGQFYDHASVANSLEVTPTAINFRIGLGGANRNVVRCTAGVTTGQVHHVIVTYDENNEVKLYVNGTLADTTDLTGAGAAYANTLCYTINASYPVDNWTATLTNYNAWHAYIGMYDACYVTGSGSPLDGTSIYRSPTPGFDGQFGLAAVYDGVFSQSDVDDYYDSFANPSTHTVPIANAGYPAEVEADNPFTYMRGNELTAPASGCMNILVGDKTSRYEPEAGVVYGATGFTGGSTAINTAAGGLLALHARPLPAVFTLEACIRLNDTPAHNSYIYASRSVGYVQGADYDPVKFGVSTDSKLILVTADKTAAETTYTAPTVLSNGTDYHVAVVFDQWDAGEVKFYIDGVLVHTQAAGALPGVEFTWSQAWGCRLPSSTSVSSADLANMVIGEMAMYGLALPATRIAAHVAAL